MSSSEMRAKEPFSYTDLDAESLLLGWRRSDASASNIGFAIDEIEGDTPVPTPVELGQEGHVLTIAPTGSGKGVGCIIPTLLTYRGPIIAIDPKGENAAVTAQRRRDMGQRVHVVDPFGISGEPAARFNPLDLIEPEFADATDDATMIARMITPACEKDPYWSNRAVQLITGIILYVCYDRPKGDRNLATVRSLLHAMTLDKGESRALFARARHPEARAVASMLTDCASNTIYGILSFASDAVDMFRGENLSASMYASSFDLKEITRGDPVTVYLVLPPHMLESHGGLLRLWVGALFAALTRRRTKPAVPTLLLIDEAAQLGRFEPLRAAITLMRGYGVRTWTFWQDASQIQRLYEDWPTIVNNCHAVQMFGRMGAGAANAAAELMGMPRPDVFRTLKADEMVLAINGEDPRLLRRPDYLADEELTVLAAPNPFYGSDEIGFERRLADLPETSANAELAQIEMFPRVRLAPRKMRR